MCEKHAQPPDSRPAEPGRDHGARAERREDPDGCKVIFSLLHPANHEVRLAGQGEGRHGGAQQ